MLTRLLHSCGLYLGPESELMPAQGGLSWLNKMLLFAQKPVALTIIDRRPICATR
jgi:hypothetical protein